jgi:hypothetical protein
VRSDTAPIFCHAKKRERFEAEITKLRNLIEQAGDSQVEAEAEGVMHAADNLIGYEPRAFRAADLEQFNRLKETLANRLNEVRRAAWKAKRKAFTPYATHCWKCSTDLDSAKHPSCKTCGWLTCPLCDSCAQGCPK